MPFGLSTAPAAFTGLMNFPLTPMRVSKGQLESLVRSMAFLAQILPEALYRKKLLSPLLKG
jgi:hypothetical protein